MSTITIVSYADGTQCDTIKITTTVEDDTTPNDSFYLGYVDSSGKWEKYKTLLSKGKPSIPVVLIPLEIEQDIAYKGNKNTLFAAYPESNSKNLVDLFNLNYNYSGQTPTITTAAPDTSPESKPCNAPNLNFPYIINSNIDNGNPCSYIVNIKKCQK